jgi:hypothetical protein
VLANGGWDLTLILLTWTKWWAPASASKWRVGFNSAFKGLMEFCLRQTHSCFTILSRATYSFGVYINKQDAQNSCDYILYFIR